jgi:hypothetical protein
MPLFPWLSANGGEVEFLQRKNSDALIRHGGRIKVATLRFSLAALGVEFCFAKLQKHCRVSGNAYATPLVGPGGQISYCLY